MTTILLARHGETDWNREGRVQGHTDRPLNETGQAQAQALAETLTGERIDAVYSSDLSRAYETARLVAEPRGLGVTRVPELREKHFGTWEGLTDTEVISRFPQARHGQWGDGETADDVSRRVLGALRRIAEAHPDGRVLVVSHGGPLRSALLQCGGDGAGAIANCHVALLELEEGVLRSVD